MRPNYAVAIRTLLDEWLAARVIDDEALTSAALVSASKSGSQWRQRPFRAPHPLVERGGAGGWPQAGCFPTRWKMREGCLPFIVHQLLAAHFNRHQVERRKFGAKNP